jgi:hypothetical protein
VKAALATLLVALLAPAASADAKQLSVRHGPVKATLTYSGARPSPGATTEKLTITRAGRELYSGVPSIEGCTGSTCSPTVGFGAAQPPLIVRDLDGDGEPEVVYTAFTGGAHCCIVAAFFELASDSSHYLAVDRPFGDPGFGVEDVNHDGRPEIVTGDDSFAYRFTSYAFSGLPLLVLHYAHGHFKGVTTHFKGRLRAESKLFWRGYKTLRAHRDDSSRGQIAAWAADQYRLGKRAHALAILRREVRRGFLSHPDAGTKFIHRLDRFLKRRGYAS